MLLNKYGYSDEILDRVCEAIRTVSFKGTDTEKPTTLEGMAVQDADRLDAIGAIGVARAFAYGGANARPMYDPDIPPAAEMDAEEYKKSRSTTINHFYEKLLLIKDMINTETAKRIAEGRHSFLISFLDRFYSEWNGKK
ncbi:MAG: phosphohydrolase, partial [Oscillospiraceae bacterium]|nr:phosphohydrolase [Oscillospiraceae bacterium]